MEKNEEFNVESNTKESQEVTKWAAMMDRLYKEKIEALDARLTKESRAREKLSQMDFELKKSRAKKDLARLFRKVENLQLSLIGQGDKILVRSMEGDVDPKTNKPVPAASHSVIKKLIEEYAATLYNFKIKGSEAEGLAKAYPNLTKSIGKLDFDLGIPEPFSEDGFLLLLTSKGLHRKKSSRDEPNPSVHE